MANGDNVELKLDLEEALPEVYMDPHRFTDAIMNLVGNAREVLQESGGGHVTIRTQISGGALTVEVADDGPGIPADIREHIFETFFTTKGEKGTGIGLSVVQRLCREMDWKLELDTEPGDGATFRMMIPCV